MSTTVRFLEVQFNSFIGAGFRPIGLLFRLRWSAAETAKDAFDQIGAICASRTSLLAWSRSMPLVTAISVMKLNRPLSSRRWSHEPVVLAA